MVWDQDSMIDKIFNNYVSYQLSLCENENYRQQTARDFRKVCASNFPFDNKNFGVAVWWYTI